MSSINASCESRQRLMFVLPSLGHMGGSIRVASGLANLLSATHDVALVSVRSYDQLAFELNEGVEAFSLDIAYERVRAIVEDAKGPLTALIGKYRPDVVVGVGTYEALLCISPCRAAKIPLVSWDHGALINQWTDRKMTIIRLLNAFFSKKVLALTQKSVDDYVRLLHVPKRKVVCMPNWIPSELANLPGGYDPDAKKLIWAGRLDKEKGVDHLLDIAERLAPRFPDWTWEVYGQEVVGGDVSVADEVERRGLSSFVKLMGPSSNMYETYQRASICTLTSYREGLPLVLLEAKSRRLPLVSFDVNTGPSDIISDGKDGYLVPCYDVDAFADKLSFLMSDRELRVRFSEASVEGCKKFDEQVILSRWKGLVSNLVQGR